MTRKERFEGVIRYFTLHQPIAETELSYGSPYELMVAVILSAQCTDKRVNLITPSFFGRYPTIESLAAAEVNDVFEMIRSCSYPNNKARHLVGMARKLREEYGSIVPSEPDELQKLPGIGRKSANVIASVIFHKPALAVDTHVFRVSARLGLTWRAKNPFEAEKQLVQYIPQELIPIAHHWLILHGRYVCQARRPRCEECGLTEWCRYYMRSLNR
ncbi:MAG TPA: endonuclease III [Bacteroidales bacterium]|nr:endonuclease III [Bacteroidales bacterium]HRZ20441.1 endonuclease III [Bacteroidales bacterium]